MSHALLLIVFAIRDAKMEAFLPPFCMRTVGEGIRLFENDVRGGETPLSKNPEDYALFQVGTYDQLTGRMESLPQPLQLCQAMQVVKSEKFGVKAVS